VMTPQLMQAIKLLQLSSLDLSAYVDAELERNPLLERSEEGEASAGEAESPAGDAEASGDWQDDGDGFTGPWRDNDILDKIAQLSTLATDYVLANFADIVALDDED